MVDVYEGPADTQKIGEFIDHALKNVSTGNVKVTISIMPVGIESQETSGTPVFKQPAPDFEKLARIPDPVPLNIPEELLKNGTLRRNADGVVLVGQTRVSLDTVIHSFRQWHSPEEIIQHFTTLALADVYGVIAFYLRERESIDEYLRQRELQAEQIRQEIETQFPSEGIKEKLLARRNAGE